MDKAEPDFAEEARKIFKYWGIVLKEFRKIVWSNMKGYVFGLVIALIIAWSVTCLFFYGYVSVETANRVWQDLIFAILALVVSVALSVLGGLWIFAYIPMKLHEKHGGFIENPFNLVAKPPRKKTRDKPRWASIDVINISPFTIIDCIITIDKAKHRSEEFELDQPRPLRWSTAYGEDKTTKPMNVIPDYPLVCDVAATLLFDDLIIVWAHAGINKTGKGIVDVVLTAHGNWNGVPVSQSFDFELEYDGGNILTIVNKGNARWEPVDPKEEDEKLVLPPTLSTVSTS